MTPAKLGVNIDHVATIRQARGMHYPDLIEAARIAIEAGADQITIHLREDRRHIQDQDVVLLCGEINKPINLEMAATETMVEIAVDIKPQRVTLVPERRRELTTEGGLDVVRKRRRLKRVLARFSRADIPVSLFIDPDIDQINASLELGARAVELHTGAYANASDEPRKAAERERVVIGARYAATHRLFVAAGHGLHVDNISELVNIDEILEFNIGHSIVARALFVGLKEAVREMVEKIHAASQ